MSQVSGALVLELDLERLADMIAARVVAALRQQHAGGDVYHREPEPGRRWRGVRFGAVTDHGEVVP